MEAIILAGGFGKRLRSAVPDLPKPMAPIHGRPFLTYQMDYWINQGVDHFILCVSYRNEVIKNHFEGEYKSVPISYSVEHEPLGTGGAVLLATDLLQNPETPFLILNGDTFYDVDLKSFEQFHQTHATGLSISLFQPENIRRYGRVTVGANAHVVSMQSDSAADTGSGLINGGVYLAHRTTFDPFQDNKGDVVSLESLMIPTLIKEDQVFGCPAGTRFIDIGVPEDYYSASSFFTAK